jgi:hypothetical protein
MVAGQIQPWPAARRSGNGSVSDTRVGTRIGGVGEVGGSPKRSSAVMDHGGGRNGGEVAVCWFLAGLVGPLGTTARRWSSGGWKGADSMAVLEGEALYRCGGDLVHRRLLVEDCSSTTGQACWSSMVHDRLSRRLAVRRSVSSRRQRSAPRSSAHAEERAEVRCGW